MHAGALTRGAKGTPSTPLCLSQTLPGHSASSRTARVTPSALSCSCDLQDVQLELQEEELCAASTLVATLTHPSQILAPALGGQGTPLCIKLLPDGSVSVLEEHDMRVAARAAAHLAARPTAHGPTAATTLADAPPSPAVAAVDETLHFLRVSACNSAGRPAAAASAPAAQLRRLLQDISKAGAALVQSIRHWSARADVVVALPGAEKGARQRAACL